MKPIHIITILFLLLFSCEKEVIQPEDITGTWQVVSINQVDKSRLDWYYQFVDNGTFIELVYDEQYTPDGEYSIENNRLQIHKYKWIRQGDIGRKIVDGGLFEYKIRKRSDKIYLKNDHESIELHECE